MISKWIGMLVRVLQRSGASRMDKEVHYEELALVVRKADKAQDLQGELARWRLRRAYGVQQACKTQERRMVWFKSKGRG